MSWRGELARRQTQDAFNAELAVLQGKYRDALGIIPQDFWPWEEPEDALDAPGLGDTVEHDSKFYRSLLACNVLTPSEAGYRQVSRQKIPIVLVEPTREHDGYAKSERAVRGSVTYESLCDKNMQMPTPDSEYCAEVDVSDEE